ncbi:MAG: ABC transporter permease subunit, partial [Eubacteriales bacterium]|nr:ABC transporter permease subunit [Eubacteriales bacterium]
MRIRSKIISAGAVLFWLIVWHFAATFVNRGLLIPIPTPVSTVTALGRIITDRESLTAVGLSVLRILTGFVCALIAGTILAVLSARFELFRVLTAPLVQLVRAIPVASFTILLFLWVSRGKLPSTIAFFTVLPVVWANVESGILAADRELVEMARVFGMNGAVIMREIV